MRGTLAKMIRRAVYGDDAHRPTHHVVGNRGRSLECTGKRRAYRLAKRRVKELRRTGN